MSEHEHDPILPNYFNKQGAQDLKAKIEAYWQSKGQHVQIALKPAGFNPVIRHVRFDLRSDMINGMPRMAFLRALPAKDKAA